MFEDHTPIVCDRFMGLYDRGNVDTCPKDHFVEAVNVTLNKDVIQRRFAFSEFASIANLKRILFFPNYVNPIYLFLTYNSGTDESNLYDLADTGTPILTIPGASGVKATDFSAISIYNRIYISLHNGIQPSSIVVQVYDGSTCRAAAGVDPASGLTAADSATAGVVSAGTHAFAYAYETSSGHITKPSVITTLNAVGAKKVDLASIDNGPTGTIKKHILATRKYDPTLEAEPEFFFIAEINDNTTTSITVNFYDFELINSADYLFDLRETIPAGVFITSYGGRLVTGTTNLTTGNEEVYISKVGFPESFDEVEGYNIMPASGGLVNGFSYRDVLYIQTGYNTYYAADNGLEPINWNFRVLDGGIGTVPHGVVGAFDSTNPANDKIFVASRAGLTVFQGYYSDYLTWKIENYWTETINWETASHKIQILNFPDTQIVYILVPVGSDTEATKIIVGDYSLGLNSDQIKWTIWDTGFNIPCIANIFSGGQVYIFLASTSKLYYYDITQYEDDFVNATAPGVKTGYLATDNLNYILHFGALDVRVTGSGFLGITVNGLDNHNATNLAQVTLSNTPVKVVRRKMNMKSEKLQVRIQSNTSTSYFSISSFIIWAKPLWHARYQND